MSSQYCAVIAQVSPYERLVSAVDTELMKFCGFIRQGEIPSSQMLTHPRWGNSLLGLRRTTISLWTSDWLWVALAELPKKDFWGNKVELIVAFEGEIWAKEAYQVYETLRLAVNRS